MWPLPMPKILKLILQNGEGYELQKGVFDNWEALSFDGVERSRKRKQEKKNETIKT